MAYKQKSSGNINQKWHKLVTLFGLIFLLNFGLGLIEAANAESTSKGTCGGVFKVRGKIKQWYLRNSIPGNDQASKILEGWNELKIAQVRSAIKDKPQQIVFIRADGGNNVRGVLGTIELAESFGEYQVVVVRDNQNRIHAIDSTVENLRIYQSPSSNNPEIEYLENFSERVFSYINLEKLDAAVRPISHAVEHTHEYTQLRDLKNQLIDGQKVQNATSLYRRMTSIFATAYGASFFAWSATQVLRIYGIGVDNFLMQHSSNFYIGLVALGMAHSGLASKFPERRHALLSITSGMMASLNTLLEVNLGLPQVPVSDWADFHSGMAGIATYWAIVKTVEYYLNATNKPQRSLKD